MLITNHTLNTIQASMKTLFLRNTLPSKLLTDIMITFLSKSHRDRWTEERVHFFLLLTMSVPKSMQRMVTVPSGRGTLAMMKRRKGEISGMLLVSVYAMDFFKLSKMRRPAATINT